MEKGIELVREAAVKRPPATPCPHRELVKRHLEALGRQIDCLERAGERSWQLRMADEFKETCRVWRADADLPPLSRDEFAAGIRLGSIHAETEEDETGTVHCKLTLFFEDQRDSFAGHFLSAVLKDQTVQEITIMG